MENFATSFFFFVKKCKSSWGMMGGRMLIDECFSFFFFWNNWYENIFLVFFIRNNLTTQCWIGFIENLILLVTLLFVILNNIQDNIWWKTRVKFIRVTVFEGWDGSVSSISIIGNLEMTFMQRSKNDKDIFSWRKSSKCVNKLHFYWK